MEMEMERKREREREREMSDGCEEGKLVGFNEKEGSTLYTKQIWAYILVIFYLQLSHHLPLHST